MDDLKERMKDHFLRYASYVILDRAIPDATDGLKPVQRRILQTLWQQHDEKLHKVANIVGQTMQLHPHGDAPIYEALVNLANKGYLLDRQGNFGNILTGDPSAAARYIETRLSPLARATLFNPEITDKIPSYDGRNSEPIVLPAKIPVLLLQGADGIAVGMSTRIFPHNFREVIQAEIACLEGKSFSLSPDFPTGGIMDTSEYAKGTGKIRLRASIEIKDTKTIIIREICYGTTTESLIRSIDEAAKKGKIKIEEINDYTARNVEIEIKLPRGRNAEETIDALYAFTECEVSLHSQIIVIIDNKPVETDVIGLLSYNASKLVEFLRKELLLAKESTLEKIFFQSLERLFIEKKMYKAIEPLKTAESIHAALETGFLPYRKKLLRDPTFEDREKLLAIPIRRISQFEVEKNRETIALLEENLARIEKHLRNVKKYAIDYLKNIVETFGKEYPRRTIIRSIGQIDRKAITTKELQIGFDPDTGFIGTKLSGPEKIFCTNFDKLLVFDRKGGYKVISVPEKQYFEEAVLVGIADKKTVINVVYKQKNTKETRIKRFIIEKFITDKPYRYLEENSELLYIGADSSVSLELKPSGKGKNTTISLQKIPVTKVTGKGTRIAQEAIRKVSIVSGKPVAKKRDQ